MAAGINEILFEERLAGPSRFGTEGIRACAANA